MGAVSRIITLYILNLMVTRGLLPEDLVNRITVSEDALLAIELAVAGVVTLGFNGLWQRIKPLIARN